MDAIPSASSAVPRSRQGLKALVLIALLSAGFVLAGRPGAAHFRTPPTAVPLPVPTPDQILGALPQISAGSLSGKALLIAIARARQAPGSASAWNGVGDVLAQRQRETNEAVWYGHAESCYRQALRLDPKAMDAMAGLAWVYGGRHQFDLSILWAEKALALDPDHFASLGIIGDAAVETGDYEKALGHYQKMMDLRPDLSSLSRGAWLLWLTGNQTRAVLLMEKAIASGGPYAENTAWCRARLAMMLFHDGALAPAAMALQPALDQNSRNPHVLLAAGRIAAARADFDQATIYYQMVLEQSPHLEALAALGDIHWVKGDEVMAGKYYGDAEALHRRHRESGAHDHMEMARFYADLDRELPEALRLAQEHGRTGNPFEADCLAWLYFKNGDLVKAVEWMKKALLPGIPDASFHYHAGCIAAAAGDPISAKNHLQQALSRNPGFSLIHAPRAARMLEQLGREAPIPVIGGNPARVPPGLTRLR